MCTKTGYLTPLQISPRWNFESLYYKRSFSFNKKAGGNASVDVVFIDTVLLAGNSDDLEDKVRACMLRTKLMQECNANTDARLQFGTLPGPTVAAETQWDFIEAALSTSKADYVFTLGHYPVGGVLDHQSAAALLLVAGTQYHNCLTFVRRTSLHCCYLAPGN